MKKTDQPNDVRHNDEWPNEGGPNEGQIDAFLDGHLPPEAQAAFVRQMESDDALRNQVELAERIDESLKVRFSPPALQTTTINGIAGIPVADAKRLPQTLKTPTPLNSLDSTASPEDGGGESVIGSKAVGTVVADRPAVPAVRNRHQVIRAAAIVIAASAAWVFVGWQIFELFREPSGRPYGQITMAEAYRTRVKTGFVPDWVCDDDHQFASTFLKRQGQGLLLADMPDGVAMVGLAYMPGLNATSTVMLAKVDDEKVLVFVDRRDLDRKVVEPEASIGLNLFRQELGNVVLYELTPKSKPRVMQYLYVAKVPPPRGR